MAPRGRVGQGHNKENHFTCLYMGKIGPYDSGEQCGPCTQLQYISFGTHNLIVFRVSYQNTKPNENTCTITTISDTDTSVTVTCGCSHLFPLHPIVIAAFFVTILYRFFYGKALILEILAAPRLYLPCSILSSNSSLCQCRFLLIKSQTGQLHFFWGNAWECFLKRDICPSWLFFVDGYLMIKNHAYLVDENGKMYCTCMLH
jgi:hypothetical protein